MTSPARSPLRTDGLLRVALLLLVLGGLGVAYAAFGLAGVPTPAEEIGETADAVTWDEAVERFRQRLDLHARIQAAGIALLAAGALLALTAIGPARLLALRPRLVLAGGLAAAGLVLLARWRSIDAGQFAPTWDHWLYLEAGAWGIWTVAVVILGRNPGGGEASRMPE